MLEMKTNTKSDPPPPSGAGEGTGKMADKKMIKKVKKLCNKFTENLDALFDDMDVATYESAVVESAVLAQGYAVDAVDFDDDAL